MLQSQPGALVSAPLLVCLTSMIATRVRSMLIVNTIRLHKIVHSSGETLHVSVSIL